MIPITARLQGASLGTAVAAVKAVLDQQGMLPPGVRYELGGLYAQQQIAFAGLDRVFVAALMAEFVLLLFLYERFWIPVIVLGASALSTTAVFAGLWLTGIELNITAIMGMTMIIGIGTEMAIFLVSEYVRPRARDAASAGAARGRAQPLPPDRHDDAGRHPDLDAAGAGHRRRARECSSPWPSPSSRA